MTPAARSSRGTPAAFVAVDWGTSSFRAWLMSAKGEALAESRGGEGMLHCVSAGFAPVLPTTSQGSARRMDSLS